MKTTSSGILVCNAQSQLLLCHATGGGYWDIPKGSIEPGESAGQTALRETAEECGLVFAADELLDLGLMRYRPAKDLHLFAALTERVDAARCRCSTRFRDRFGRERPEMDAFEWVPFDAVTQRCAKSMAALLGGAMPLADVLRRLQQRGRLAAPAWGNAAEPG
jgi:putative (di)nucleoside polyphosphate hydrolase